jgi:hypothetical protein
MEISYENMKGIVDMIELPIDDDVLYKDRELKLSLTHDMWLQINGRTYNIRSWNNPERIAAGFPAFMDKSGTILFHYEGSLHEQRSWILHELTELELMALGVSGDEAHKTAKKYEEKYRMEKKKNDH